MPARRTSSDPGLVKKQMHRQHCGVRELWGTFSVRDHLEHPPFATELMLYDRLVVPVPASEKERDRWERADLDWHPAWQQQVLSAINAYEQKNNLELVLQVPWNDDRRHAFNDTITKARAAGFEIDGYQWTAGQLLSDRDVKRAAAAAGVKPRVIAAYVSRSALEREVVVEEITADEMAAQPAGTNSSQLRSAGASLRRKQTASRVRTVILRLWSGWRVSSQKPPFGQSGPLTTIGLTGW